VPEGPEGSYRLEIARPAARAVAEQLPEAVAAAVIEFVTGDLLRAPRRVGKPLRRELECRWAARRGSYRILYVIDDDRGVVIVVAAEHRRDVYRRR
jgi:mRNA interferase RelE/StbE